MRLPALRPGHKGAYAALSGIAGLVLLPIAVLAVIALRNGGGEAAHLVSTVLPKSALVTAELLMLVAALTGIMGVVSAWLVVDFEFPLRRVLSWALVLPIAIPTYIAAYAFVEFFNFAGPVQTAIRALSGFQSARDYWFPNVRSLGGAAVILSLALYPYVYLTTRAAFMMQSRSAADVARSLGAAPARVFWKILLPMARPAIAAGVSLVMMETLNDLGAVEYLGVRTLTFSVYNTWLAQGSLGGAAQLACVMLVVVFVLLRAERHARRQQRFFGGRRLGGKFSPHRARLTGAQAVLALSVCLAPVLLGFGIPFLVISGFAVKRLSQFADPALHSAIANSALIGSATALVTVTAALGMIHAGRIVKSRTANALIRLASIGYCLPGTVLALGLLFALAAADNWIDALVRAWFGVSSGLLMTGSTFGIVLACSIRFLTLGEGAVQSGLEKIHGNLEDAARSLGQTPFGAARLVTLPLLRPAVLTALALVFVDTLKELPATILLRPIGLNTLATLVYENASRAAVEDAAAASLLILLAGLVPVIFLSRILARPEQKNGPGITGAK